MYQLLFPVRLTRLYCRARINLCFSKILGKIFQKN